MDEELFSAFTRAMNESALSQKRPSETCSHGDEDDWSSTFQQQQMELLPFSNPFWPPSNNQPENILIQTSVSTSQASQATNNSNASLLKRNYSKLSEPERDRKRKTDKKYRERCKKVKVEMVSNLEMLMEENNSLKKENGSLKADNAMMNQTLGDQAKEIDQLRNNLSQLKSEYGKQNVLVQTLSGLLADPLRIENEKLKDENASLRKNANLNNNLSQLEDENARLRIENKVLKVQNDALCGKIISDKDKKCEQEQEVKVSLGAVPLMQ
ncbi:rab11 family-interacting protein 3-like isoform X2 [Herrania umbratica]|nr:rab11 family-interacting protein 3-like isoform X2 [Herrania umbratica]